MEVIVLSEYGGLDKFRLEEVRLQEIGAPDDILSATGRSGSTIAIPMCGEVSSPARKPLRIWPTSRQHYPLPPGRAADTRDARCPGSAEGSAAWMDPVPSHLLEAIGDLEHGWFIVRPGKDFQAHREPSVGETRRDTDRGHPGL